MFLTACNNKKTEEIKPTGGKEKKGTIKLWVDAAVIDIYKPIVKQFENEHKGLKIIVKPSETGKAQENVKKDPSAAADVFMMPHDQLGQLVEAGTIYPNTKYANNVKKNNAKNLVDSATYNGKLYGYPYGMETLIAYYNKSKLTAEEMKTWETITKNGKLGTNFSEENANYVFVPLFMSNGDELYGKTGENIKGTNFNNEKGVQVLNWIYDQKDNKGVVQSNDDALSRLRNGEIDAFLSGPWSKNDAKKALGKNFAVTSYPTVNFGNGEVQQKAFLGVKLFCVNASTKNPLASMALADYLTKKENQLTVFEKNGIVPSNKEVLEQSNVQSDAVVHAVMTMSNEEHSVIMPKLPEMVSFWEPADALINDTYNHKISKNQFQSKLDKLVKDTSKSK